MAKLMIIWTVFNILLYFADIFTNYIYEYFIGVVEQDRSTHKKT